MYIHNVAVAFDQLVNTVLGGCPQETLSIRLGRKARKGSRLAQWACWLVGKVFFRDTEHCYGRE